ncbi:hypothetical protein C8J46_105312 [Sphingomonas sp. PP-F2F-A104-K0414]|uniref:hypothetical protein n=1 Tax=Sphingomonas sp. PP-F2F-A104-K0414 TaxID=2135661 RepID=UPI0010479A0F|nr:hypothetical protein [Sphingomonas sp. PP-F2F-A104-K0414]TCP98159.1 hypothetical protein C8J46_105312 [Sphingomonas sp. PP-F2F-A104-K0414]
MGETLAANDTQKMRSERKSRRWDLATAAVFTFATVSVGATVTALFSEKNNIDILGSNRVLASRAELDARLIRITGNLQQEITAVRREQDVMAKLSEGDRTVIQLARLSSKLDVISARQAKLEEAIQRSPEEALTMPLMKRDIENIKDGNQQSIAMIKASVDQIYNLTQWLLGALTLGVLALVATTFMQRRGGNGG